MDTAALSPSPSPASGAEHARVLTLACTNRKGIVHAVTAVSYTHLTLPTTPYV